MKATLCRGVRIREEEFGGIVIIKDGGVFKVDSIGFEILSHIKNNIEIDEIMQIMEEKFEGDPERIKGDIHKFIQDLIERGAIEIDEH